MPTTVKRKPSGSDCKRGDDEKSSIVENGPWGVRFQISSSGSYARPSLTLQRKSNADKKGRERKEVCDVTKQWNINQLKPKQSEARWSNTTWRQQIQLDAAAAEALHAPLKV